MTGFSQSWLDLREAADHRSRNSRLARLLAEHFATCRPIRVLDLGCGTGSNLRATAPLLGPEQHWRLIDHDEGLLAAAASRLRGWAHASRLEEETLVLSHGAKRISVEFTRADLARDLMGMLSSDTSLVAASALMDLVSGDFIARLAASLARYGCALFSVLTYDGDLSFLPRHQADDVLLAAFNAHQRSDKGFGPAAGPDAARALRDALLRAGYAVIEGMSPWRLGKADQALIGELAEGFAGAAGSSGVDAALIGDWRALCRTGAVVGHIDTLALPAD